MTVEERHPVVSLRPPPAAASAPVGPRLDDYPSESRRWIVLIGVPMVGACVCIALAIGTSVTWLYGGAVLLGPGFGVAAIIYLAMSTDTNGGRGRTVAVHRRPKVDRALVQRDRRDESAHRGLPRSPRDDGIV